MQLVIDREDDHGRFSFIAAQGDDGWYFVTLDHWADMLKATRMQSPSDYEQHYSAAYQQTYVQGQMPTLYPRATSVHTLVPRSALLAAA